MTSAEDRLAVASHVMRIARGYTYRETAAKLAMKVKTRESHMSRIFEKLGVATRSELSFLAYETGMVDPADGRRWAEQEWW